MKIVLYRMLNVEFLIIFAIEPIDIDICIFAIEPITDDVQISSERTTNLHHEQISPRKTRIKI